MAQEDQNVFIYAYAHSRMQSMLHLTRTRTLCTNTSPSLAGAVESSYEDYSVTKDTEENSCEILVQLLIGLLENRLARVALSSSMYYIAISRY